MYWNCKTHDTEIKGAPFIFAYYSEEIKKTTDFESGVFLSHGEQVSGTPADRFDVDQSDMYCPGATKLIEDQNSTLEEGSAILESCEWQEHEDDGSLTWSHES